MADAAISGLLPQKTLPAKLFYDEEGCRLFATHNGTAGILPDPHRAGACWQMSRHA